MEGLLNARSHPCNHVHAPSRTHTHVLDPPPSTHPAELYAVVTHKGRSADSGHYMAWVRHGGVGSSKWLVYDDDAVSETDTEYVTMTLKGGGDDHMR